MRPERKTENGSKEGCSFDSTDKGEGDQDGRHSVNEPDLQRALAEDRLRSLKKAKSRIEKEISVLPEGNAPKSSDREKLLLSIVKENSKPKRKLKEAKNAGKGLEKRKKTVSFDDDADFDAVLDAASAGFVETVSYKLFEKSLRKYSVSVME